MPAESHKRSNDVHDERIPRPHPKQEFWTAEMFCVNTARSRTANHPHVFPLKVESCMCSRLFVGIRPFQQPRFLFPTAVKPFDRRERVSYYSYLHCLRENVADATDDLT